MTTFDNLLEDERIVVSARVVVHTTDLMAPNSPMSDNHWSIYLLLENNMGSIRFNMREGSGAEVDNQQNTTRVLECTTHQDAMPSSRLDSWDYAVPGIDVGWMCTVLWNQVYELSGGGSGCRWWVAELPEEIDYVNKGN
ncbi:hypothetical protein B7494_g8458 [Chlorociboria aeruginascens]|nr:hypothetical protein B7494_g8458 [Chlorociboria aeruginascens]